MLRLNYLQQSKSKNVILKKKFDVLLTLVKLWSIQGNLNVTKIMLCRPMEFSIKFDTFKSGWSIVYNEG